MRMWMWLMLAVALPMNAGLALAWTEDVSVSPVDDSKKVVLIQEAETTYENRYGRVGRANMQILCETNKTGLALVFPELYTSDNGGLGEVTFRVDNEPAFDRSMIASNDHGSMVVLSGRAISALKEMIGGKRLLVRFITVNEPSMDAYFSIEGIGERLQPVREECGW